VEDCIQAVPLRRLKDNVDVIRHDAPREQEVANAIKLPKSLRNYVCNEWLSEMTHSRTSIQILLHPFGGPPLFCWFFSLVKPHCADDRLG
jgi:hypothetical protein